MSGMRLAHFMRQTFFTTSKTTYICSCQFSSKHPIDFPDMGPPIPEYIKKNDETVEVQRSRLQYQSRKRGMSENGLILSNFANKHLKTFTEEQLDQFDNLINKPTNDWDIFYWILEKDETPDEYNTPIMDMLKEYTKNESMETRYHQPDLDSDSKN